MTEGERTMKTVLAILSGVFLSGLCGMAHADEAPPEHSLPGQGVGCVFKSRFEAEKITCGSARYEVWSCSKKRGSCVTGEFLLIGNYETDVQDECSPTYVVKRVLAQKKESAQ
jgi:hypothetical protein